MQPGSVNDLSGYTAVADNEKLISEMPTPWNIVYGCGDRLCHQKADRSFFINENQMPFCSRCTAIWLGLTMGLGLMVFYKIELDERFLILIAIGIVPIGVDGVGQLLNLWESTNIVLRPHVNAVEAGDINKTASKIRGYKVTVDPLGRIWPAND